jgi:hypothetical protein
MVSTNFWSFAERSCRPPIYGEWNDDTVHGSYYTYTFDVCTVRDLLERLPEMLDEDVYLHRTFLESLNTVLLASANKRQTYNDYNGVQGSDFVHVVYDGDEPQAVVYHGATINDQLVEADHKRYNLQ